MAYLINYGEGMRICMATAHKNIRDRKIQFIKCS